MRFVNIGRIISSFDSLGIKLRYKYISWWDKNHIKEYCTIISPFDNYYNSLEELYYTLGLISICE